MCTCTSPHHLRCVSGSGCSVTSTLQTWSAGLLPLSSTGIPVTYSFPLGPGISVASSFFTTTASFCKFQSCRILSPVTSSSLFTINFCLFHSCCYFLFLLLWLPSSFVSVLLHSSTWISYQAFVLLHPPIWVGYLLHLHFTFDLFIYDLLHLHLTLYLWPFTFYIWPFIYDLLHLHFTFEFITLSFYIPLFELLTRPLSCYILLL
jgi:hypothetical protein